MADTKKEKKYIEYTDLTDNLQVGKTEIENSKTKDMVEYIVFKKTSIKYDQKTNRRYIIDKELYLDHKSAELVKQAIDAFLIAD